IHNQLTGNDDALSLEYTTAGFNSTSIALVASYGAPVMDFRRLRWRGYGSYSAFEASDVGASSSNFNGQELQVGAEVIWNFFQHRDLFLDGVFGGRFDHIHTRDNTTGGNASADFGVPYVSLRAERTRDTNVLSASSTFSYSYTGADRSTLAIL